MGLAKLRKHSDKGIQTKTKYYLHPLCMEAVCMRMFPNELALSYSYAYSNNLKKWALCMVLVQY